MTKKKNKEVIMHRARSSFLALAVGGSMLLWGSIAATPASAAIIVYNFTGDVTNIQQKVEPLFGSDESAVSMTGSMSVDSTTPGAGLYNVTNFSVTIGTGAISTTHTYTLPGPFLGVGINNGA